MDGQLAPAPQKVEAPQQSVHPGHPMAQQKAAPSQHPFLKQASNYKPVDENVKNQLMQRSRDAKLLITQKLQQKIRQLFSEKAAEI
jgi:hypothetical protein